MSNTRYAAPGAPLSQNRFASSYPTGLLGNLVAKRCESLTPEQSKTIWFLQWLSWQPGGLEENIERIFGADWCKNGSIDDCIECLIESCLGYTHRDDFCLYDYPEGDPDLQMAEQYRLRFLKNYPKKVVTQIGHKVSEAIDYALENRCMVLVDGVARIGKSFATRDCCERSAGMMRYCQVPSSDDDGAFFRAIAKALGVSSSIQLKAQQYRAKIEDTLQNGQIGIVFDEAHYLFHSAMRATSLPRRINWIMTALVNYKVPTVLVTTPQFHSAQKRIEQGTHWTSEQFIGRIAYVEKLPDCLPIADLFAVAKETFPEGDKKSWDALAAYADTSKKHLAAIDDLCKRARWFAAKAGRQNATASDLKAAMKESGVPQAIPRQAQHPRGSAAIATPALRGTTAALSHETISRRQTESHSLIPS